MSSSHITEEITENQRRVLHLPGVLKSNAIAEALNVGLDQQYSKKHLLPHDPGAWVGPNQVSISSPGALPLPEVLTGAQYCTLNLLVSYIYSTVI
jgi:hypothetical protein